MKYRSLIVASIVVAATLLIFGWFLFYYKGKGLNEAIRPKDVSQELTARFKKDPRVLAAAKQVAGAIEQAVLNPADALAINELLRASVSCLKAIENENAGKRVISDTSTQIISIVVDTPARVRAYLQFSSALSGQMYPVIKADASSCEFDSSASGE